MIVLFFILNFCYTRVVSQTCLQYKLFCRASWFTDCVLLQKIKTVWPHRRYDSLLLNAIMWISTNLSSPPGWYMATRLYQNTQHTCIITKRRWSKNSINAIQLLSKAAHSTVSANKFMVPAGIKPTPRWGVLIQVKHPHQLKGNETAHFLFEDDWIKTMVRDCKVKTLQFI